MTSEHPPGSDVRAPELAELLAALAELATLPLPAADEWQDYHHQARIRLAWVADVLGDPARLAHRPSVDYLTGTTRAMIRRGLQYEPHPGAQPKTLTPGPDLIVVEGGQP